MLQLNWKAAATVATGATALVGWLASPSEPAARGAARSKATAPAAVTSTIEEQATRLSHRLRPAAAFDEPRRNPFRYQSPTTTTRPTAAAAAQAPAVSEAPQPVAPAPFAFRLSGTARDGASDDAVWTAILAGGTSGLVLAKVGDTVGNVYRVESVTDTTADLVDVRDGRTTRLTLPAAR